MAQLQENYRHILDNNTYVENFPDQNARQREVGEICQAGGQLLSDGGYPLTLGRDLQNPNVNLSILEQGGQTAPAAHVFPEDLGCRI